MNGEKISIAIQAGGESARMGRNKALMPFKGEALIARVARRLSGLGDEIFITTNLPDEFAFLGYRCEADILPGMGALGGLYTALNVARHPLAVVLACDLPLVNANLLRAQLALLLESGADVVLPRSPDGLEPLHGVYQRERCLPAVEQALLSGGRRMIAWLPDVNVREMSAAEVARFDPFFHSFVNVNTPAEFAAAEVLADGQKEDGEPMA